MLGIGYIDKNGFLEGHSFSESISFITKRNGDITKTGLARKISEIGNRIAQTSDLIKEVHPIVFDGSPGFEVILRNRIRPVNLQRSGDSKKYLKLDLSKEGTIWKWEEDEEHKLGDPSVSIFVFRLYKCDNKESEIPISAMAFGGKVGKNYTRTFHPNVHENGNICMGGFQGYESLAELSVGSLAKMLMNEAIYSSYRKPNIRYIPENKVIHIDTSTIDNVIKGTKSESYDYIREFTTVEEWL